MMTQWRFVASMLLMAALLAIVGVEAKHAGATRNKAPARKKQRRGGNSALMDGDIDFENLAPRDCATFLCAPEVDAAAEYIEAGCPGQFSLFESKDHGAQQDMEELALGSFASAVEGDDAAGITTGTLMALASASGVFAAGMGFLAGYKSSPSFAYMQIPSLP